MKIDENWLQSKNKQKDKPDYCLEQVVVVQQFKSTKYDLIK